MKLKELVDIKIGLALERKKAKPMTSSVIMQNMLTLKSFEHPIVIVNETIEKFMASEPIGRQYLTEPHNVIVRLRTPIRAICIDNNHHTKLLISSLMAKITIIYPNLLNDKYLAYYINSQQVQHQLNKNIQGTTIPMTKIIDLLEININLPTLEEQIKIVNFLETANHELYLLQQIIEQKNKLKNEIFETLLNKQGAYK